MFDDFAKKLHQKKAYVWCETVLQIRIRRPRKFSGFQDPDSALDPGLDPAIKKQKKKLKETLIFTVFLTS